MHRDPVFLVILAPERRQSSAALRRALELIRVVGGTLHVCSFVSDPYLNAASERGDASKRDTIRQEQLKTALDTLLSLTANLALPPQQICHAAIWCSAPHEAILAKSIQIQADLVLKDIQCESVLGRALFTPLDWKLIRLMPNDLMLVTPNSAAKPKRILAAVDVLAEPVAAIEADCAANGAGTCACEVDSSLNQRIMTAGRCLAAQTAATLELASVAPWERRGNGESPGLSALIDELTTEHLHAFKKFSESQSVDSNHRHRLLGTPADALVNLTEQLAVDVTVMGNIHHDSSEHLFLGSTAELLLQRLRSDLLLVKPQHFLATLGKLISPERLSNTLKWQESRDTPGTALASH